MKKNYEDEQMMVIHQSAQDLFEIGVIDSAQMREFDELCLVPAPKPAKKESEVENHSATA
jgi:DNA-binding transcriptional regulator YiaG